MQNAFTTHEHIEQTLRYLSMFADMVADKTNEGIVMADLDGSLLFVNEAWCGMHGYKSKDELIGKQLSGFHTKEQMKTDVIPLLEKTKQCGQIEDIVEHIKSNGTVFATQTKLILVEDGAGKAAGFIIFAANISQPPKLKDTTVDNLKQIKHLSVRIAQLRKLFGECRKIGECLAEQTIELRANNEMLLKQISGLDQSALIPEQYAEQILPWKAQGTITNELSEDANPEQRQPKETPAKSSEPNVKSKRSTKLPDTKELRKVAELARRLSEFSNYNIQSEHKNMAAELELCSTKTKAGKAE
jgi:PAS domain S-box-containing protein